MLRHCGAISASMDECWWWPVEMWRGGEEGSELNTPWWSADKLYAKSFLSTVKLKYRLLTRQILVNFKSAVWIRISDEKIFPLTGKTSFTHFFISESIKQQKGRVGRTQFSQIDKDQIDAYYMMMLQISYIYDDMMACMAWFQKQLDLPDRTCHDLEIMICSCKASKYCFRTSWRRMLKVPNQLKHKYRGI